MTELFFSEPRVTLCIQQVLSAWPRPKNVAVTYIFFFLHVLDAFEGLKNRFSKALIENIHQKKTNWKLKRKLNHLNFDPGRFSKF